MEIEDPDKIREWFNWIDLNFPDVIVSETEKGDRFSIYNRHSNNFYIIDDPSIYQELPIYRNNRKITPTGLNKEIFEHFNINLVGDGGISSEDTDNIKLNLFEDEGGREKSPTPIFEEYKKILPFSRIFEEGRGMCLESSILFQLALQDEMETFLVEGKTANYGDHAFNIVSPEDCEDLYLMDINNAHENGKEKLLSFDLDSGEFNTTAANKKDRPYHLNRLNEFHRYIWNDRASNDKFQ